MLAGRVRTLAPFGNQIRSLVRQLLSNAIGMVRHIGPQEARVAVKASPLPVTTPQFVRIGSLFPDFFNPPKGASGARATRFRGAVAAIGVDIKRPSRALDDLFGDHDLLDAFEA